MDFQEKFEKFKQSKWVVPTYIVLVILATFALAYFAGCLALILIPILMFAIPYYMGERRLRFMLLLGLIIVIVDSIGLGLLNADFVRNYEAPEQKSSDEITITRGTITPATGGPDTVFNFTVTITANLTDISSAELSVWVNISETEEFRASNDDPFDMNPTDSLDIDATDGKNYYRLMELPEGIHFFHFSARIEGEWYDTLRYDELSGASLKALGPINAEYLTIFRIYFLSALVIMIFTSILFFVFVMMYWWIGRSRIERARWEERIREAGELEPAEVKIPEFECTNCGRPVHEDALRCPHCGAIFEEGEEEEEEEEEEPEEEAEREA